MSHKNTHIYKQLVAQCFIFIVHSFYTFRPFGKFVCNRLTVEREMYNIKYHTKFIYQNLLFLDMYFLHSANFCGLSTIKLISAKKGNNFISHFSAKKQGQCRAGRYPGTRSPSRQNWRNAASEYACSGCSVEFQQRYP